MGGGGGLKDMGHLPAFLGQPGNWTGKWSSWDMILCPGGMPVVAGRGLKCYATALPRLSKKCIYLSAFVCYTALTYWGRLLYKEMFILAAVVETHSVKLGRPHWFSLWSWWSGLQSPEVAQGTSWPETRTVHVFASVWPFFRIHPWGSTQGTSQQTLWLGYDSCSQCH